jgi:hypothetical protein
MTSDRKRAANRANARSSTGPRTAAGKARAAKNAVRHGVRSPVLSDPVLMADVESLAKEIAGEEARAKSWRAELTCPQLLDRNMRLNGPAEEIEEDDNPISFVEHDDFSDKPVERAARQPYILADLVGIGWAHNGAVNFA